MAVLAWAGAFEPQAASGQAPPAFAPGTESGFATFQTQCAQCHGNPHVDRAPTPSALREMTPEKIYDALTTGVMTTQASALNDGQKKALAEFMAGRPIGSAKSGAAENMGFQCRTNPPLADPASGPSWNGWSPDLANTRFQPRPVARRQQPRCRGSRCKWAFWSSLRRVANAQPTIASGQCVRRQR
jgi:cytochrome c553